MKTKYKLRFANKNDISRLEQLFRDLVAERKSIMQPDLVISQYIEEFVAKIVESEEMLIVEDNNSDIRLFGEIHNYNTLNNGSDELVEMVFHSQISDDKKKHAADLVNWLYDEISNKRKDVFRVELTTQVKSQASLNRFRKKGIMINGRKDKEIRMNGAPIILPLSWPNPSFRFASA